MYLSTALRLWVNEVLPYLLSGYHLARQAAATYRFVGNQPFVGTSGGTVVFLDTLAEKRTGRGPIGTRYMRPSFNVFLGAWIWLTVAYHVIVLRTRTP